MSLVINDKPGDYYSGHDDLLFVVYEATKANDSTTYPDYKYVADVYVDGVLVTRVKKDPNPTSKRGVFNIGSAVRSYLAATFNPASSFVAQQLGEDEFYIKVTVKFGEEYDGTLYTNVTIDQDRFYFNHYNGKLLGTRTALAAKLGLGLTNRPYLNKVMLDSGRSFVPFFPSVDPVPIEIKTYNHVNTLVTTKNTSYVPGTAAVAVTLNLTLFHDNGVDIDLLIDVNGVSTVQQFTPASLTLNVNEGDIVTAYLWTISDGFPWPGTGTPWANMYITENGVTIYNQITTSQGAIDSGHALYTASFTVQNREYNIVANANNTTVPTTDIVDTTSTDYIVPFKMQLFDVCPATINALYAGLITDYIKYYTVQIGATSIYRFDLTCEPRYTNNTLHFLNQYGGFESFDFSKVSRKNITVDKKDFGKLGYTVSDAGLITYKNANGVYNEQKAVYSSQFTEGLILNTDILSDDEYTWLGDLIISPLVYIEQDGYFLPVTIQSSNYDFKKQINDKLTNLTITLSFGEQYSAQYR